MNTGLAKVYFGGLRRNSGGALYHALNLKKALGRMGWRVQLVTLDDVPIVFRFIPHLVEKSINLIMFPLGYYYRGRVSSAIFRLLGPREGNLNIFEDVYLAWNSNIPSLTMLHALWSDNLQSYQVNERRERKLREEEATSINRIEHPVATVSVPYRNYIASKHLRGLLSRPIEVIELGIEQSKFKQLRPRSTSGKRVVYSGSLEARKNLYFLIDVFAKIYAQDPKFSLTFIGSGSERDGLSRHAAQLDVPVTFLGRISYSEVITELGNHDLYLHTSVKESFSYSLLEAKLAGLITFALNELEVPAELIDVGLESFDKTIWTKAILNRPDRPAPLDQERFTSDRMAQDTLRLAGC